jgi:hypothetical protein
MAPVTITYEEAKEIIGILPSLGPRPNAVNIRALSADLEQKLETIPSHQSPEHGYAGMVMDPALYALRAPTTPWNEWPDPGPHAQAANTTAEQANLRTIYEANKAVFDSQQNVRRAVNDALNKAIPAMFRKPIGAQVGTKVYTVRDDPKQIIMELRDRYGRTTPNEKAENDRKFNAPWASNEPIESYFDRLEDCYIFSIMAKVPYTFEQLIDKALIAIQRTGLYNTALLEWAGFEEVNKTWSQLKLHFQEAYEILLASGQGTAAAHGYVNNTETVDDDDSITTIQESLNSIHLANQAHYASLQVQVQDAVRQLQQSMANMEAINNARNVAPPAAPPIPHYVPAPPAMYAPPPPPVYQGYGQQGYGQQYQYNQYNNRRGRGGRGNRNNRRYNSRARSAPAAYGGVPPTPGVPSAPPPPVPASAPVNGIPPPPAHLQQYRQKPAFSNVTKHFNNWNMCFTCGWDVESWHNSQTCNMQHNNPAHQRGCTRENAKAYMDSGHRVSTKAMHKTKLPENPGPDQA